MKIAVVGTGYVGLVTGTCLAETGNQVTCIDIDEKKVEKLKNMIMPIYEPGLDVLFERNIKQGRLNFTTNLTERAISPEGPLSKNLDLIEPSRQPTQFRVEFRILAL